MNENSLLYRSGDVFLPKSVRQFLEHYYVGNGKSVFYLINWSFVHLLSGVVTGYILLQFYPGLPYYTTGFIIHTLWEFWQIFIGMTKWRTARGQMDIVVDTVMFMIGMNLFSRLFTGKEHE